MLTVPGSGSTGSPVTIRFEAGAIFQSPRWPNTGAIRVGYYNGAHSDIIIDGGSNGIIENTANGTGLTYHGASSGISIEGLSTTAISNIEVKNLTIRNIYLNLGNLATATDTDGQSTQNINCSGPLSNISVHNCVLDNARSGISGSFDGFTWESVSIYDNYISDHCWGISVAGLGALSTATNLRIYNNEITDWVKWSCPSNAGFCNNKTDTYHTDGIITYSGDSAPTYAPLIYNNYIHGDLGSGSATGFIFCTVGNPTNNGRSGSECIVFNNLLVNETSVPHTLLWFGTQTKNNKVYNNTIIGTVTNDSFNPCIISSSLGGDIYKNNICSTFSQIFSTQWAADPAAIIGQSDNNVFYNIGSQVFVGTGASYTLAQWKSLGRDTNSVTTSPNLSGTYHPQSGSSAINAGADLTSVGIAALLSDKAGVGRPNGSAWDIGVYEYVTQYPSARGHMRR